MTLNEIKQAHKAGITVYWSNDGYKVTGSDPSALMITCGFNGHSIGLTWLDGVTLNGKPNEFYIKEA